MASTSIVMSTHNGEGTLPRMLEACAALEGHRGDFEIVAIDNASTDGTASVIERFKSRLPITYLRCERRGKNIALNYGLERARGDLLVFTDDDVIPARDWLKEFEALAEEHPSIAIFGGRIDAVWPSPPPRWTDRLTPSEERAFDMRPEHRKQLAFGVHPENLKEGSDDPWVIGGGNMAVRADLFKRGFRFNESVGPAAGQYVMGSETEFTRRVSGAGYRCFFSRRPVVQHIIRETQFERDWILRRVRRFGKHWCVRFWAESQGDTLLWGMPRWRVRRIVAAYITSIAKGAWFGTESSFAYSWRVQQEMGFCQQFRALSSLAEDQHPK